ncbi:MAG: alpha/beta fold hydrolase [Gloeocapsa sp. DLM2.Bin57]|nr:MAG: alpha/beta fold hydrolase [Gloeocapsa sp. DLM2.Bin57]
MPLPTVILPGYLARGRDYYPLQQSLIALGIPTRVVPIRKRDWLPTIGRSVTPIIKSIDQTVKAILTEYGTKQVNLIGHSAGGWIARIYLGEKIYDKHTWKAHQFVHTLVTLGTPHYSQERWTRKNLAFVEENYPGAFYDQVRYICVAGKAVYGEKRTPNWFAYNSYRITCGEGNTWGDGITPIEVAHLPGATNLTLEGVRHAPGEHGQPWYGSSNIIPDWISPLKSHDII